MVIFIRTDGRNKDFIENCRLLDMDLDRRVGKQIKREAYRQYNMLDEIRHAIVVYENQTLIGGGAIRKYDDETTELKRVFVHPEYQGQGTGSRLVSLLIEWAVELGYQRMILETGELLAESCAVYRKSGFQKIPNYGPYVNMPESLCMAKNLKSERTYVSRMADGPEPVIIREIRESEYHLLADFLYEAIFVPEGMEPPPKSVIEQPELQVYLEDFGKADDCCLIAEVKGKPVGAVWARIMDDYGHIDDETPSLAISLYAEYRHCGIGTALMRSMLALLKNKGYRQVSLSVQKANYAVSMYRKTGFVSISENEEEYIMVCRL